MPSTAQRALKAYLWIIAVYHLFVGLAVNMSDHFTKIIAATYGATVDWTPQFTYILHPLGAFMIVLGFLAAVAARDPERYDAVIFGFIGLFLIRALHRVVLGDVITGAFAVPSSRNTLNMIVMTALAVLLFFLWRAARARPSTP